MNANMHMKTIKLGCSNIYIALTLVGALPLIGGVFGIYLFIDSIQSEIRLDLLIQSSLFFIFGLLMCTYRSCLYATQTHVEIRRKLVFLNFKRKIIHYNEIDKIFISIRACVSSSDNPIHESDFYGIELMGERVHEDLTDFMRFNKDVDNKGGYSRTCSWISTISEIGGVQVVEHEKVQNMDKI